jgi:hypothetical protein
LFSASRDEQQLWILTKPHTAQLCIASADCFVHYATLCMYVCMDGWMDVPMYVCIYVCSIYECRYVPMYICTYIRVYVTGQSVSLYIYLLDIFKAWFTRTAKIGLI